MPIPVTCPECQRAYALAEHLGGKRVVCAQCQTAFDVPAPEGAPVPADPEAISRRPPARRLPEGEPVLARRTRRWDDEDADLPPPRQASKGVLFVAVAGGLAVLACAGLGLSWFLMRAAPPPPAAPDPAAELAAQQPRPGRGPGIAQAGAARGRGNTTAQTSLNRGTALFQQNKLPEAAAAFREALRLQPDYAEAHCLLGQVLRAQNRFGEALEELKRGDELGRQKAGWQLPSADWLRECEALIAAERDLPAYLAGKHEPADANERSALIYVAVATRHVPLAGARLAATIPADDPTLNDGLRHLVLYNGACGAALAVAGNGNDARQLPDKLVGLLRHQALRWLRDDLARVAGNLDQAPPMARNPFQRELAHWQEDTDLVAVRDPVALSRLPEEERRQWQQLWDDVAALLAKAGAAN
jgi:tetratricopeptide (TPR) repeat protein